MQKPLRALEGMGEGDHGLKVVLASRAFDVALSPFCKHAGQLECAGGGGDSGPRVSAPSQEPALRAPPSTNGEKALFVSKRETGRISVTNLKKIKWCPLHRTIAS